MLALDTMSPEAVALFFVVAFVALVVAVVLALPWRNPIFFIALGLASWMLVNAWNALALV